LVVGVHYHPHMQISATALTSQTLLQVQPDDAGTYDLPRRLVLALQGAAEAQTEAIAHLYQTNQVQPGDVIASNWPEPPAARGPEGDSRGHGHKP
jgi:hypothetical protein